MLEEENVRLDLQDVLVIALQELEGRLEKREILVRPGGLVRLALRELQDLPELEIHLEKGEQRVILV